MDILLVLIVLLSMVCVWLTIKQKLDDRKLAVFAERLGKHGIRVRTVGSGCTYCRGHLMRLSHEVPTPPPPGAHDLGLMHEESLATFCTKCGVEHEGPGNLSAYMDRLDGKRGG